ncbi:hypothetical protein GCM10007094_44470 [Pseudovibrio japonicus]|uniref:Lantibiotic biosynthesis protein dehydration domain-containing protein n=1 Tax=Pseudovibrio japonicus TaxID=366534 RepID=A0ABQ3ETR9_9HYPH|nr:lanthionine synthetase LanC family protein [Pseudovibrio japonicus]GHB50303.1 hypothetical protein GCM10007094_44470 [Pseudovibrio japonicus]
MQNFNEQITSAIDNLEILSPTSFSWMGHLSEPIGKEIEDTLDADALKHLLISRIQTRLYENFYSSGGPVPIPWHRRPPTDVAEKLELPKKIIDASTSTGWYQNGWHIEEVKKNGLVVANGQRKLFCRPDQVRPIEDDYLLPYTKVDLKTTPASPSLSPGYLSLFGNAGFARPDDPSVRFYLHASPDSVTNLVASLTKLLNDEDCAFTLKVMNFASRQDRCDAVVLYLSRADFLSLKAPLLDALKTLAPKLLPGIPMLTKRIANGIGMADNPITDHRDPVSFGSHRCRLIARAMTDAFHTKKPELEAVLAAFKAEGLDPEKPYLGSDGLDEFDLIPEAKKLAPHIPDQAECLTVARQIGVALVKSAIWHENRCTWFGAINEVHGTDAPQLMSQTLPHSLYGGTAGVALFLAELYAAMGDIRFKKAANGALNQTLAQENIATPGFYSGGIGLAYAALRFEHLTGDTTFSELAQGLITDTIAASKQTDILELGAGLAGTLLGLVLLQNMKLAEGLKPHIRALADTLCKSAAWQDDMCTWQMDRGENLGMLHGTSGIAHSLLSAHALTDEPNYLKTALGALRYTDQFFLIDKNNWQDRRMKDSTRHKPSVSTSWCNGTVGMAMLRTAFLKEQHDGTIHANTILAAESTLKSATKAMARSGSDFCLCHGLSGSAEALQYLSVFLDRSDLQEAASEIIAHGYANYHQTGKSWPCGVLCGSTPGLMTGLSGIGYFYLRQAQKDVPSLLMIT